jgi:hypothetical protein
MHYPQCVIYNVQKKILQKAPKIYKYSSCIVSSCSSCSIFRTVIGPLDLTHSMPLLLNLFFLLVHFFPSARFMSSYFSCESFSLFHRVSLGKNSTHYSFLHTLMILATMPYAFLSFLFLFALTLPGSGIPSLLHSPSEIHLAKDFTHKESANSLPDPH